METKGTDWNESNHQSWAIGTYDGHDDAGMNDHGVSPSFRAFPDAFEACQLTSLPYLACVLKTVACLANLQALGKVSHFAALVSG